MRENMWSWMAPAMGAGGVFVLAVWISRSPVDLAQYCAGSLALVMLVLILQGMAGFRAYYRGIETAQFEARRRAQADTAEVRLFDACRGMHPEAVRLLFKHRLEVWRIREMPAPELLLAVLDADPRITLNFLEYVLEHSNPFALMPKRMLSDKAHSFDPRGVVTDYEQYDALHALLERRDWLTAGFGNQPGQWIEPMNPELVARRFGITFEREAAAEAVEVSE